MSTLNAIYGVTRKAVFNENILPVGASFASDVSITKVSGTAGSTIVYSTDRGYRKTFEGSIRAYNDTDAEPLVFNFGTMLQRTVYHTGKYVLSLELLHNMVPVQMFQDVLKVKIKRNGVFADEMICTLNVDDIDGNNHLQGLWGTYAQVFLFNNLDVIDFEFELITEPTKPSNLSEMWIDAIKLEFDNKQLGGPTAYSEPI